jgi:serine/threonine protein kinase
MLMKPPSRQGPSLPPVEDFLRVILRSGLIGREQLQDSLRNLPSESRNHSFMIAEHLIKQGKLSRFQASKLLRGSHRGLVLGHYQVLAPIGRGGMGNVYLARDQRSSQLLALKVLPPDKAKDRILARFRREMEMSQRVSHPHIAWTFDTGVWYGVYYLAMEYIPGKSLHRMVMEQGQLAVPRATRLLAEVAAAVGHMHEQG